ncbi:MAG: hypothetical protein WB791_04905 [Waddliaceae bacterium]
MAKTVILAKRPDVVLKLEKYGLLPPCKTGGRFEGCAKEWAKKKHPPYDQPVYQAMAERLPTGWEELTIEEVDRLLERLSKTINMKKKAARDLPNKGVHLMLKQLIRLAFIGIATASSLIADLGLGLLPDKNEGGKRQSTLFTCELVVQLINGSGLLTTIFQNIARVANTDEKNQMLIADILTVIAALLALLAASKGNPDRLEVLLMSCQEEIREGIDKIESFLNEGLATHDIEGDRGERIALSLQQAQIALKKEDADGFYEAYRQILSIMEITPDLLAGDLKEMDRLGKQLRRAFTVGLDDETNRMTAIAQAL